MNTITNIYQSQRLAQLGVPVEKADYCYIRQDGKDVLLMKDCTLAKSAKTKTPAWSMGQLLEIVRFPVDTYFSLHVNTDDSWTCEFKYGDIHYVKTKPSPLDVVYEMYCEILWKNELKQKLF